MTPYAIAVNTVTNKIYVADNNGGVTVIDGSNNATTNRFRRFKLSRHCKG